MTEPSEGFSQTRLEEMVKGLEGGIIEEAEVTDRGWMALRLRFGEGVHARYSHNTFVLGLEGEARERMARSIVMEAIEKAKEIILDPHFPPDSCEGCPEVCPLSEIGGWDLCQLIEEAAPLSERRALGVTG